MNDDVVPQATGWINLVDRLWHILASPRLTIILLVWLAVFLTLGGIIPQAPLNIEDPVVRSQWLGNLPIAVRPAVERLLAMGVFDLLDTVWFRLPLVLLLAHALVALANWGWGIWCRVRCQPTKVTPLGSSFQFEQDYDEPAESAKQHLINRLGNAGYRVSSTRMGDPSEPDQSHYVASRWRWNWLGLAGIYLGLALASVGLIMASWLGEVRELKLAPDDRSPLPISARGDTALVLEGTTVNGHDPLRPTTGVATVTVSTGVAESQDVVLTLHNSRLLRGMWATLIELRPMITLAAVDLESDERIVLQPFAPQVPAQEQVRVPLTGDPETHFVGVPSENVTLHLSYQADSESPSYEHESPTHGIGQSKEQSPLYTLSLSFFRGAESTPSDEASLQRGGSVDFEGVRYTVIPLSYDATLRLHSSLWWIAAAAGWGMTVLSFITLVVAPPVYIFGSVEAAENGSRVVLTIDFLGGDVSSRGEVERLLFPPKADRQNTAIASM